VDEREVLTEALLDLHEGLIAIRGGRVQQPDAVESEPRGTADTDDARAAAVAGERERLAAGRRPDLRRFHISRTNVPPGSRVKIGSP